MIFFLLKSVYIVVVYNIFTTTKYIHYGNSNNNYQNFTWVDIGGFSTKCNVSINILLFHIFLSPPVLGPGLFIFLMNTFLLWAYRADYIHLIKL